MSEIKQDFQNISLIAEYNYQELCKGPFSSMVIEATASPKFPK